MQEFAAYVIFIIAAVAISFSVVLAAVFCIGLSELGNWMWSRFHPEKDRYNPTQALGATSPAVTPLKRGSR